MHHWEFEGDATDSVGTHDGTAAGDATFAAGLIGQAASLDGDGDGFTTGQSSLPENNFTMTAWIYRETAGDFMYIAGTQQSGNAGAFLRVEPSLGAATANDALFANLLPPAATERVWGGVIPLNAWAHVAMTVSSSDGLTLFIDGAPVASDPLAIDGHGVFNNFTIGARPDVPTTFGFDGLIDDLRIYASALSPSEIAALAGSGSAPLILKVSQSNGNLDFEWNSMEGMQYDLVSSIDLLTSPSTWMPYNDGVNPVYENIPATGAATSLTGVVKDGAERFFALIEEEAPPLFSEDFELSDGGFTSVDNSAGGAGSDWAHGNPSSNGGAGGGSVTGGAGMRASVNCWGTDIGAYIDDVLVTAK